MTVDLWGFVWASKQAAGSVATMAGMLVTLVVEWVLLLWPKKWVTMLGNLLHLLMSALATMALPSIIGCADG